MPLINKQMLALGKTRNKTKQTNKKKKTVLRRETGLTNPQLNFGCGDLKLMCDAIQADQLPFLLSSQEHNMRLCSQGDDGIRLLYNATCLDFFLPRPMRRLRRIQETASCCWHALQSLLPLVEHKAALWSWYSVAQTIWLVMCHFLVTLFSRISACRHKWITTSINE